MHFHQSTINRDLIETAHAEHKHPFLRYDPRRMLATACADKLVEPSHVGDKTPHLKTTGTDNPQPNDQLRPPAPKCDLPSPSSRLEGTHPQGERAAFEGWYLRLQNWQSQRSYSVIVGWWREATGARARFC